MIKVYGRDNWTVRQKPSALFVRERLSNGQYMNLWIWRNRVKDPEKQIISIWTVGLYIGNKKGAALWRRSTKKSKQTGDCGLEGLRTALIWTNSFASNLGSREELQIAHEDDKRQAAYKWLLRYPGFTLYEFDNAKDNCIAFRHPDCWEWEPNQKGSE